MHVRTGENEKTWFRTERYLHTEDGWYFLTREQTQEGPYRSKEEAARELNYYIRYMSTWGEIKSEDGEAPKIIAH